MLLVTIALAGCGGGAQGGVPPGPTAPPAAPAPVTFQLDAPGSANALRTSPKRDFVDLANATQLTVTVSSVNGAPVHQTASYGIGSGKPVSCAGVACTLSTTIPVGLDVLQLSLADASNRPLAQNNVTFNVVQGANTIDVTLNGIVTSLQPPTCGVPAFSSKGQELAIAVVADDADGVPIQPPGLYGAPAIQDSAAVLDPLTISSADPHAAFSVDGRAATNPATIAAPGDTIALIYSGTVAAGSSVALRISSAAPQGPGGVPISPVSVHCSLGTNAAYTIDPSTTFSGVPDTASWQVAQVFGGNAFNAACNSFFGATTLCYYPISGGAFGPVATQSAGTFDFTYSGYALTNYTDFTYAAFTIRSLVLTFVDRANAANTFSASVPVSAAVYGNTSAGTPATIETTLSPPAAPILTTVAGTSTGATDYVVVTYVNSVGQTLPSAQSALTPRTTQQVHVASPAAYANALSYNVFASHTTGRGYAQQNASPIPLGTNFTVPGTLLAGAAVPGTNTSGPPTMTLRISGGTGVFAGVAGSITAAFTLTPNAGTLSLYSTQGDAGTMQGI